MVETMYYAVRDKEFYVETAIGIMRIQNMFEASCFANVTELIEFMQSYDIFEFDIYAVIRTI